jgi:hypothetical protein
MSAESIDRLIELYLALIKTGTLTLIGASIGVVLWSLHRRYRQRH